MSVDVMSTLVNVPAHIRRAIAITILVTTILLGASAVAFLFSVAAARQDQLDASRIAAGRLLALGNLKLSDAPSAITQQKDRTFFAGASDAVIRGNIQSRLTSVIQNSKARMQSIGNVPPMQIDGIAYVGMAVNFSGTHDAIVSAVHNIESNLPRFVIRHSKFMSSSSPATLLESSGQSEINAYLKVYTAQPNADDSMSTSK